MKGLGGKDGSRQGLGASGGGDESKVRFGHCKGGVGGCKAEVAEEGHFEAGADAVAVDGGNEGFVEVQEETPEIAAPSGVPGGDD